MLNIPGVRFAVGACGTKFGKLLSLQEIVPTVNGWSTIGDLVEGDYIFDHQGHPTLVEYITDTVYSLESYSVEFSDGNSVVVDAGHLWETETHASRKAGARVLSKNDRCKSTEQGPAVRTTKEILESLHYMGGGKKRPNHSIPVVSGPLEFREQDLLLDPYVLGAWLGYGHSNGGGFTCDDKELFLVEEIRRLGFEITQSESDAQRFNIKGLYPALRCLGVLGDKRVPSHYLIGSPKQRLALLQGLMDTAGTISKRGDCCFDNTNKGLADSVANLCQTLGIKVNREQRVGRLNGVDKKLCYRVQFTTDLPVFRLPRKLKRIRAVALKAKRRYIVDVRPVESVPMKCIRVASPRHLFLVGEGCIPTHNTYGTTIAIIKRAWDVKDSLNWWVSPTFTQAKMVYEAVKKLLPKGTYEQYKADLKLVLLHPDGTERSHIEFKSGDNPDSLRGFGVNFFVMDEAARCQYESFVSLLTTVTQTRGVGYIISTPHARNWFYDVYQWGEKSDSNGYPLYEPGKDPHPEWRSIRMPTWTNPHVPLESIEEMRRTLPEPVFHQEVGAQFLLDSAGVFNGIKECIRGELQASPTPGSIYVMGVDLGRLKDFSVLTVMDKATRHVVYHERFNQISWDTQYHKIIAAARRFNALVAIDSTGIGDPIVEAIQNSGVRVSPYKITSAAAKQQLIDKLRVNIENQRISFPMIPVLKRELESYEYVVSDSGVVRFSAPSNQHDDCVISLALANWFSDQAEWKYTFRQVRGL